MNGKGNINVSIGPSRDRREWRTPTTRFAASVAMRRHRRTGYWVQSRVVETVRRRPAAPPLACWPNCREGRSRTMPAGRCPRNRPAAHWRLPRPCPWGRHKRQTPIRPAALLRATTRRPDGKTRWWGSQAWQNGGIAVSVDVPIGGRSSVIFVGKREIRHAFPSKRAQAVI